MLLVVNTLINEPCCTPLQVAATLNQCYEKQTILITKSEKGMSNLEGGSGGSEGGIIHSILGVEINGVVIWFNFVSSVSVGDS